MNLERQRLVRFTGVAIVGFVIDGAVLTLLANGFGVNPYLARVPSFTAKATTTWLLNRRFAFRDRLTRNRGAEYARYVTAQIAAGLTNFAIYAACLSIWPSLKSWPVLALIVGASAGFAVNYTLAHLFVFRGDG